MIEKQVPPNCQDRENKRLYQQTKKETELSKQYLLLLSMENKYCFYCPDLLPISF